MTGAVTEDARLMEAVAAQRRELAILFGGLDVEAWDHPTLCAGWRVVATGRPDRTSS